MKDTAGDHFRELGNCAIRLTMATETTSAAPPLPKTHDSQSAANLERVTDYAEEKEIVGDFGQVDMTLFVEIHVLPVFMYLLLYSGLLCIFTSLAIVYCIMGSSSLCNMSMMPSPPHVCRRPSPPLLVSGSQRTKSE